MPVNPAVIGFERPDEGGVRQRRSGQRLVEDVRAEAPGQRQDGLRHGAGKEDLLPRTARVRLADEFPADPFKVGRSPLLRRRFDAVFFEQIEIEEKSARGEIAEICVLLPAVHQQVAGRLAVSGGRVEPVFTGEPGDLLEDAHRSKPLYRHMIDKIAGHAGNRLDQRALVVGRLEPDGKQQFAVLVDIPVCAQPPVERFDLFDPVR